MSLSENTGNLVLRTPKQRETLSFDVMAVMPKLCSWCWVVDEPFGLLPLNQGRTTGGRNHVCLPGPLKQLYSHGEKYHHGRAKKARHVIADY